jgi:putative MATE family efflux protein
MLVLLITKQVFMSTAPIAKFTQGSIRQHLIVMAGAGTTGMMVMFLSELVDMYFLSLLGEVEIAAAVGFAGSVIFFTMSINIGLTIACSALVSTALGQGDNQRTKETVTHCWISAVLVTVPMCTVIWFFLPSLLRALGAEDRALELAVNYTSIIVLSMPVMAVAMAAGGVMRANGQAKAAMSLPMVAGIVNVILDPIFIFVLELGVTGAAIASVISRFAMLAVGCYFVVYRGRWLCATSLTTYFERFRNYISVAIPAVLTNLSTPIGIAFVTYAMAQFGDSAVAGNAIISRIQPVAFAGIFALSGIIGPVAGQNYGANKIDRVFMTLTESIRLVVIYTVTVCCLLWLLKSLFVPLFNASDAANEIVYLFCSGLSLVFVFHGFSFITNALFNNLGVAHLATIMNFAKATVGTVPFIAVGAWLGGPAGILWGIFVGAIVMGLMGLALAYHVLKKLEKKIA